MAKPSEQSERRGFRRDHVVEGGPAQIAGIQKGDVIETIDGLTCVVPDWDREPINPFKWVAAGDLLELTVRRGAAVVSIGIRTTARPHPMGDTEALMRQKAKSIRGDQVFDQLAAKGAELRAARGRDGKLSLESQRHRRGGSRGAGSRAGRQAGI